MPTISKPHVRRSAALACVLLFTNLCFAQGSPRNFRGLPETAKKAVGALAQGKRQTGKLTLLSPFEVSKIVGSSSEVDPCNTALDVGYGQTLAGDLTSLDCQLDDGSFADFYAFQGEQGVQVTIDLTSTSFDTYLGVANASGTWTLEDDDSGGGTNSRIIATLPETGTYYILANSVFPNTFGSYFLSIQRNPACSFTLNPSSAQIPGEGGTAFTFDVVTQPGCHWTADSNSQPEIRIVSGFSGNGSGTVTYSARLNNSGSTFNGTITAGGKTFSITQPTISCSYSISPESVDMPGAVTSSQFTVTTGPNCVWSAFNNDFFIWIDSPNPHTGPGTVDFHVIANNTSVQRTGTVTIADKTFTVRQAGLGCTFSVSPTVVNAPASETFGTVNVDTQPGCFWIVSDSNGIVQTINGTGTGTGPGTFQYRVFPNSSGQFRSWILKVNGGPVAIPVTFNQSTTSTAPIIKSPFDLDGDQKTDMSIFRPSDGTWWYVNSRSAQVTAFQFGSSTDKVVAADFTGDGKTDIAFWRPSDGFWNVLRSEDNSFYAFPFGAAGDIPMPADYDGDGKADPAVFRPSSATWFILRSSDGQVGFATFGANGDQPVAADYDGDGKADIGVFRDNAGNKEWWISRSTAGLLATVFGQTGDKSVQADYTGDGKADVAIFRPSNGQWLILRSEDYSFFAFPWGTTGDVPVPGDYDGDGKTDAAIFRPSNTTWYINRSTGGPLIQGFGLAADQPIPNAYVR